jgi:outer membrane protein assembly factor BamB
MNVLLASLLSVLPAPQDWPHWRGPSHDGSSAVTGLPAELSREKGVRWTAEMPGPSAATPIVLGERVFTTAAVEEAGLLLALCLERATGELRWEDQAGSGYQPRGKGSKTRLDDRSDYCSPSPVADGERVVFLFGNGDLVAYDLDGKRLWARNLQKDHGDFAFQWTYGASPTLWGGRLFLPVLQRDRPADGSAEGGEPIPSFLLALDPATGKDLYVAPRASEARMESLESYATVIPCTSAGREELLVVGGDVITGHDPASGKELWRWGTWNEGHREQWWRVVPSPVVGAGRVLVCAPKRAPAYAIELGGNGVLGADAVGWQSSGRPNPVSSDVPTPLFHAGRFFVQSESGKLSRVEPVTGKVEWSVELPDRSPWEASPTGADGRVWCLSHTGVVCAVDERSGELLAHAALGEEDEGPIRSSIAAAHGALFVRTGRYLHCLGN